MDDRKEQLQVGAGLQESRLNTDLIQWLNKWSTPALMVIAVIVLGYVGMQKLEEYRDGQIDSAFAAYEASRGTLGPDGILTGNPDNLMRVAGEHDGKASIWELSKLDAAEIWLGCAWRGLKPGTNLQDILDEDVLSEDEIAEYLTKARGEFEQVLARVEGNDALRSFELRALDGLSAVAMGNGDREKARELLERLAERAGEDFARIASIAQISIDNIDSIPLDVGIIAEADMPASANAPIVIGGRAPQIQALTPGFDPSMLQPLPSAIDEPEDSSSEDSASDDGTGG